MANSRTKQQQPPPTATSVVSGVAAALAGALTPLLAYAAIEPLLEGFELATTTLIARKSLRAALQQVERFPQPKLAGVGIAQRNMVVTNTVRRAAYVVAATRRIAEEMTEAKVHGESEESGLSEAVSKENVYFLQHVNADAERIASATSIDSVAARYGDIIGWYANDDERVTAECRAANGKNFRVSDPPSIGYPGATHVECRCYPGPPHANAELLSASSAPVAAIAASNAFDPVEFTQKVADLYGVPVELAMPRKQVSKESVNYRRAAPGAEHRCGTCVMYKASRCDLVKGYIDPKDVCDKWEAKPDVVDLVFVPNPGDGPNTVRHVRSARGVAFFHAPIGTPITEAEYQSLLAARRAARAQHPQGHPERLNAERAVRQARKTRTGGSSADVDDPAGQETAEVQQQAQQVLDSVKLQASVTGKTSDPQDTESEIAQLRARLAQLEQSRAGRETGRNANTASRVDDKRIAQGQTKSAFVKPDGKAMSKSEIGDTYEQLFATHGAPILEKTFGKPYEMISHAHGGARNTPLDFRLGNKYGGELKTMSATSESAQRGKMKTAIKKEEIDRKTAALEKEGLKPLLVVQSVDQASGRVDIYTHDAFASKFVKTMRHVGSYNYTHADFHDANTKAGYGSLFRSADASKGAPKTTSLSGDAAWSSDNGHFTATVAQAALVQTFGNDGDYFDAMNAKLRSGEELSPGSDAAKYVAILNKAKPFTSTVTAYRGVTNADRIFGPVGSKVGETFVDKGVVATSPDLATAERYGAKETRLVVTLPPGTQALKTDMPLSNSSRPGGFKHQWREYTLAPNSAYRITSDKVVDGVRTIEVTHLPIRPIDAMAARLTADEEYQRLLDIRREMQAKYPVGHPERVKAERAVRQARKKIHGGGETPKPRPARPAPAPTPRPATPTAKPGRPAPVSRPLGTSGKLGSKGVTGIVEHQFTWAAMSDIQQAAEHNAEAVISRQLDHHAQFVPGLLVNDNPINFVITKKPDSGTGDSTLGTASGSQAFSRISLHPKIFDHQLNANGRRTQVYPRLDQTPEQILADGLDSGWWVPTDRKWTLADNVIAHEIGHQVHNVAFSDHADSLPQSQTFWDGLSQTLGVDPPTPTIETTGYTMSGGKLIPGQKYTYPYATIQQWLRTNRSTVASKVSQYATGGEADTETKPREMLAEMWAEYTLSSNPGGPAKFYGDYVRNRLNEQHAERKAEAAIEQAAMRDYPKELFDFNPATQDIAVTKHLESINVNVTRMGASKWEIVLLDDSGHFQGAYGRGTYQEVVSLLQDTWVRKYKRERAKKT